MGCLYLKDSHGMSALNRAILEDAAGQLRGLRVPWVIGGDWNLEPATLAASGFPGLVEGVIVHPPSPPAKAKCLTTSSFPDG